MYVTVPASEIRPGDVILAESPRYHGPDVRVTHIEHVKYGRPFAVPEVLNFSVEHLYCEGVTRLAGVPLDKPYRVQRAEGE